MSAFWSIKRTKQSNIPQIARTIVHCVIKISGKKGKNSSILMAQFGGGESHLGGMRFSQGLWGGGESIFYQMAPVFANKLVYFYTINGKKSIYLPN